MDSCRSKTDAAMVNTVLCKIQCHNITDLIQRQEVLGFVPAFWKDEQAGEMEGEILPMVR